jgi:diguanylate cyclase (GGDEF)-like protein/putative nucleotidyltransferase with HDIG domain
VVVAGLIVAYMRDRIERLVHRLTDAARTDPLTGLLNRRAFEELFELELERARRGGRNLSVLVGDLDGFKQVNDRLGHAAGDAALERLAADLEKWKRRIDAAARVGGEEFALLLPETDERGAFLVAERLRRAVLRTFSDDPLPITISFGLASWPEHGDDPELLMRAADQALYAAKDLGRDRSVIYSAEVASMLGRGSDDGEIQLATVVSLAEALDIRDTGTAQHSQTVGRYARLMAEELGLTPDRVERIRVAGILHDVGKIGIADGVLTKPGPLDDEEWTEMRTHPQIAARLLARPEFSDLRSWILAHHERLDGSGYPEGLSDEEIPLEARVLAVADAFEAMTADRVYRSALGEEAARAELEAGVGSQFDAEVVDAFLRALDREAQPDAPAVTN